MFLVKLVYILFEYLVSKVILLSVIFLVDTGVIFCLGETPEVIFISLGLGENLSNLTLSLLL
jgi:hypothetical protein